MLPKRYENKELIEYGQKEFDDATRRILKHKQSTIKFQASLSSASNVILNGDYTLGRLSHNTFTDCVFENASLKSVAGAGSGFKNIKFKKTDISNAGFQNSTFENCVFTDCKIENS